MLVCDDFRYHQQEVPNWFLLPLSFVSLVCNNVKPQLEYLAIFVSRELFFFYRAIKNRALNSINRIIALPKQERSGTSKLFLVKGQQLGRKLGELLVIDRFDVQDDSLKCQE